MHTHTHHTRVHTQACTTCSDINWVLIFTLFSRSVHVHECTHLCTHIVMYIACTPYICHTHSTHSTHIQYIALLRKWNLVHNTYMHTHTCTHTHVQYTCTHAYHEKNKHTHTHMYIARKAYSAKLCSLHLHMYFIPFNCFMHVFNFCTLSLCTRSVSLCSVA